MGHKKYRPPGRARVAAHDSPGVFPGLRWLKNGDLVFDILFNVNHNNSWNSSCPPEFISPTGSQSKISFLRPLTAAGSFLINAAGRQRRLSSNLAHLAKLVVLEGLLDFGAAVHYERTVTDNRLGDWFAVHDQELRIAVTGFHPDAVTSAAEDNEVAFTGQFPAIHNDFAAQNEKCRRMSIGQR